MSIQSVPPERDDETGRYTPSWSDEDFLEALRELGGVAGTNDVADWVECSRKTARRWLNDLADRNRITKRELGNTAAWILDD
jgi:predicted transcriptional regulator